MNETKSTSGSDNRSTLSLDIHNTTGKYILDTDGNPVEEPDLEAWGRWMEQEGVRRVANTVLGNAKIVSTVFLGLDHSFSDEGPPILFETMVFPGKGRGDGTLYGDWHELDARRYSTRENAVLGHEELVAEWENK